VLILLTLGLSVLALAVSQFQMVATLAREGARWGSVRGAEYQQTTSKQAATSTDIYNNAILPKASGLSPNDLTYSVTWSPDNKPGSLISVTVNYQYLPSAYFGPINMSSTSVMTVSY
jgi:hypothetical protein